MFTQNRREKSDALHAGQSNAGAVLSLVDNGNKNVVRTGGDMAKSLLEPVIGKAAFVIAAESYGPPTLET